MEGTTTGDAVRAGGPAVAIAAIGFAVLQAAQSLAGSFNPRIEVMALIAVVLLTATLVLQRLRTRDGEAMAAGERGERLKHSLRIWPVMGLDDSGPDALGLFPPRRDLDDHYIPRDADGAIRQALAQHSLVILVGPEGAGKTRSAIEALRQALPDALVVVPRNGAALRDLLELDPKLRHVGDGQKHRVLWLDAVSGCLEAIDADLFPGLLAGPKPDGWGTPDAPSEPVTIVATSREEAWQAALSSEKADGEAAKVLLSHAVVVQLSLKLSRAEQHRAANLYPGLDFSAGIGPAISSAGEPRAPADDTTPKKVKVGNDRVAIRGPGKARRDRGLLIPAGLAIAALAAVAGFALTGNFDKAPPPSIAEQAASAAREGAAGTRAVIMRERADLHGSGESSYVFAFDDGDETPEGKERAAEIQVWDQHGDDLELAFRFEPSEEGVFQVRGIADIDGDGADELVGGYGTERVPGELLVPFALDHDDDSGGYRLVSLAPQPPALDIEPSGGDAAELRGMYESRLTFVDVEEGKALSLSGFRSQDFVVTPEPRRLISAYVADIHPGRETRVVEVEAEAFDLTGGSPQVGSCELSGVGILSMQMPFSRARLLHNALLERWLERSKNRYCVVAF